MNERWKELLARDEELNKIVEKDPAKVFDFYEEKIKIHSEMIEIAQLDLDNINDGVER
jgi:hypothetical protein